jgi:DNA repair exonuclease SbcCD ATPase subunit
MRIQNYKKEVETILAEQKETDIDYLNQLITENLDKKTDRNKKQIKNQSDDNFLDAVELVLGEDGVKNLAMKTILPTLNQTITNMANQIHLPYSIKFDDKFNCIVNALGEEINPRSMSTGERKKADFIIIIAMLKLLKIRYPSLNILFLDEIFSSVDSAGIYEIVKILNEVSKENRINTWVINHTELPTELFDKRVEAIREGGFSKLIIEKIS